MTNKINKIKMIKIHPVMNDKVERNTAKDADPNPASSRSTDSGAGS